MEITTKINNLSKVLIHYNQLTAFPYSDLQIIEWAKSINELMPELSNETLKFIIDRMKIGYYPFDNRLGIQNIFNGIKQYLNDEINRLNNSKMDVFSSSFEDFEKTNKPIQDKINILIPYLNKLTPKYLNPTVIHDGIL